MEFNKIEDNMIVIRDGKKYEMVVECQGVNYDLMSRMEKVEMRGNILVNITKYYVCVMILQRDLSL